MVRTLVVQRTGMSFSHHNARPLTSRTPSPGHPPNPRMALFFYPLNCFITSAAFWPPKPKLVETAMRAGISRAVLGT